MDSKTYQAKMKYVQGYLPYFWQIQELQERLKQLNLKIESLHSPQLSQAPSGGVRKELDDDLIKRDDLERRVNRLTKKAEPIRIELLNSIDEIGNTFQAKILELRYIQGFSVEQVSEKLGCSDRQVVRHTNHGIKQLGA